jgi:tRNA(Arg) A34 adenosine deaminase TadA
MKITVFLAVCLLNCSTLFSQDHSLLPDSIPANYFVTRSREEYISKLTDMPFGIRKDDPVNVILKKIDDYLVSYVPRKEYADDYYARESNLQAIKGIEEGGYGIGAVLIDSSGRIIARDHNMQIQKHRSDLHAEMTLLTDFEDTPASAKYINIYVYKPGLTVFSSAEPCPMCFIRLATVGVDTKYCTSGPDDGMVTRISCLPPSWSELAKKHLYKKAASSPLMQKTAHLLFYSFFLDNRGPR